MNDLNDFAENSLVVLTALVASLFFVSFFASSASAYTSLSFSSSTIPATVDPGSQANLLLTITNAGTDFSSSTTLQVHSSTYVSAGVSNFNLGTINAGGSTQVTVPITVSSNAPEGTIALPFTVSYNVGNSAGAVTTDNSATVIITKRTLLEITNVSYDKSVIQRGDTIKMTLTVQNVGKGIVKDLTMALSGLSTLPIAPADNDVEKYAGNLNPGDSTSVSFNLVVNSNADTIAYSIPVTLTFFDDQGVSHTDTRSAGLKIVGIPDFVVAVEKEDNIFAGATGKLTISIANSGTGSAKYLATYATATDADVNPKSNYIGNMDPDDTNTLTLDVSPKTVGNHQLTLHLTYRDSYNQQFSKDYPIQFIAGSIPITVPPSIQFLVIIIFLVVAYIKRSYLIKMLKSLMSLLRKK